jgi:uncharacterized membrane protein YfhO
MENVLNEEEISLDENQDELKEKLIFKRKSKKDLNPKLKRALPYIFSCLTAFVFVLVIYAINGIYPFGDGSVVNDDMVQQTIPNYIYFWDFLHSHGSKSLIFNWETAAGIESITAGFYIIKPWDIIFTLLAGRDGIVNGMSWYLAARYAACAVSATLFLDLTYRKLEGYWKVLLSFSYAFSAYSLIYYTNMGWLDCMIFLPLIALAFLRIMKKGKCLPYILLLSYFTMMSLYMAIQLCLFLVFASFYYIFFIQPKNKRKTAVLRFGVSSVIAIALSGWITWPTVHYLSRSERYVSKSSSTIFGTLLKAYETDTTYSKMKLTIILLLTGMLVSFLIILASKFKEHRKASSFFLLSVLTLVLPVFFENINLIWHLGSYVGFPLRFAYMLIFINIAAGGYVLSNFNDVLFKIKGVKGIALILPALASAAGAVYILIDKVLIDTNLVSGIKYSKLTRSDCETWMFLSFALFLAAYSLVMFIGSKKAACALMSVFLVAETGLVANKAIGVNADKYNRSEMYNLSFVDYSAAIASQLGLKNDNLTRIKDKDTMLNSNYPLIFNYPAMSNFTHMASSDLTKAMEALGYNQIYSRVLDTDGTILTDSLLNIKYIFSNKDLPESEYTYIKDLAGLTKLYSCNYTLPEGLIVNKDFVDEDPIENDDSFATNNDYYKILSGDSEDIFETEKYTIVPNEDFYKKIHVDGTKEVYLDIDIPNTASNRGTYMILINGEKLDLRYFNSQYNYNYPNNFFNNMLDIGEYTDEDIEIGIYSIKEKNQDYTLTVGYFDSSKMQNVVNANKTNHADLKTGARSLSAECTNDSDSEYLFLPIYFDDGWQCEVNGKKVEISNALSSFMAIPLEKGENKIEMKYVPSRLKEGIIVSIAAALILVALILIKRKKSLPDDKNDVFLKLVQAFYFIAVACAAAGVYAVPIFFDIFSMFR